MMRAKYVVLVEPSQSPPPEEIPLMLAGITPCLRSLLDPAYGGCLAFSDAEFASLLFCTDFLKPISSTQFLYVPPSELRGAQVSAEPPRACKEVRAEPRPVFPPMAAPLFASMKIENRLRSRESREALGISSSIAVSSSYRKPTA